MTTTAELMDLLSKLVPDEDRTAVVQLIELLSTAAEGYCLMLALKGQTTPQRLLAIRAAAFALSLKMADDTLTMAKSVNAEER